MPPTWQSVIDGADRYSIEQSDAIDFLRRLPDDAVDLVVTSPPYTDARLYLEGGQDLGIARGAEEWVTWMAEVCHELRRVCKGLVAIVCEGRTKGYRYCCSPFLLMADLCRAGFAMRKPPVFHKVGIPGSGGPDWWRNDWEPVVCFARGGRLPWSDSTATGKPPKYEPGGEMSHRCASGARVNEWGGNGSSTFRRRDRSMERQTGRALQKAKQTKAEVMGVAGPLLTGIEEEDDAANGVAFTPPFLANPGNVIKVSVGGGTLGSPLAHRNEAPFPEKLVEPFVRCFCPPGGIVLDPFAGSGTTLAVAVAWGRRALGCDLRESQVALARERLSAVTPTLFPEG